MRQAVIFVHGIGDQHAGFSTGCEDRIRDQVGDLLGQDPQIIYKEAVWAPVFSGHQDELWRRVKKGDGKNDLDMVKLRKFMVTFAGDAIAYQNDSVGKPRYDAVHQVISDAVDDVRREADGEDVEFTFVAHSLGTVITSNWLWDHRPKKKKTETIATNLFTLGSPIALWLLRWGPVAASDQVITMRPDGAWINILDDEDVIGYPLRPINKAYKDAVDMDYITEVGGLLSMGNPMSHVGYWTDRNVYKPIAKKLAMDYERIHTGRKYQKASYLKYIRRLWNF